MNTDQPLRIVGISCSPRHANTEILVKAALKTAEAEWGCETVYTSLAGKSIGGCVDCKGCVRKKSYCILKDDWLEVARLLIDPVPNGVIIGAPVYFFSVNSQTRAFMERCTSLIKGKWEPDFPHPVPDWSETASAAVTVGFDRHGGQEHALAAINNWFLAMGFPVVSAYYNGSPAWQLGTDARDSVIQDELGMANARETGRRVAQLATRLYLGSGPGTSGQA